MAADGLAETAAIIARVEPLTPGAVFEGVPDVEDVPRDSLGRVKDYCVIQTGETLPMSRGRGLGVTEAGQPHIYMATITWYTNKPGTVAKLRAAGGNLLRGWTPNPPNSGELKVAGGYSYTRRATENTPTRWEAGSHFETVVNMVAD